MTFREWIHCFVQQLGDIASRHSENYCCYQEDWKVFFHKNSLLIFNAKKSIFFRKAEFQKRGFMSTTIQMRKKGSITIPKSIRQKYTLDENDPLTLIDLGEGIFISPKKSVLPKLVTQIENLRKKHGISLDDLIQGIAEQRK